MDTFYLYLISIIPNLKEFGIGIFIFGSFAFFGALFIQGIVHEVGFVIDEEDNYQSKTDREWILRYRKFRKICLWVTIPFIPFMLFVPSQEWIMAIVGYELLTRIDGVSELPAELIEFVRAMIEQHMPEGIPTS